MHDALGQPSHTVLLDSLEHRYRERYSHLSGAATAYLAREGLGRTVLQRRVFGRNEERLAKLTRLTQLTAELIYASSGKITSAESARIRFNAGVQSSVMGCVSLKTQMPHSSWSLQNAQQSAILLVLNHKLAAQITSWRFVHSVFLTLLPGAHQVLQLCRAAKPPQYLQKS